MPTITPNITLFKYGTTPLPSYTLSDLVEGQLGYLFFTSGLYVNEATPYEFTPPNITQDIDIDYRVLVVPTYDTVEADVVDGGNELVKTGDGYSGVILEDVASGNFTVQFTAPAINKTIALSLQTGATSYSFLDPACDYALVFLANGTWSIWKAGVAVSGKYGNYAADDVAMMHVKDGLLYFYKVSSTGVWTLLYTTRPSWSYPITPVITLYTDGAIAELPLIYKESAGTLDTATLSVQAVLKTTRESGAAVYFQGWGNSSGKRLTGEVIEMAGGGSKVAKSQAKERLRFWQIVIENESETLRSFLETFIDAHSVGSELERSFWFWDYARGGNDPIEYTCHFEGDFTDPKGSANVGTYSIFIVESSVDLPI